MSYLLVQGGAISDNLSLVQPRGQVQVIVAACELSTLHNLALVKWVTLCKQNSTQLSSESALDMGTLFMAVW